MSVSAVSAATDTSYYTTSSTATSSQIDNPNSSLEKTDFLQMLITKLENQDPLSVDDSDFTSELAQYSSLEQTTSMSTAISEMSTKIGDMNTNLIGLMSMDNTAQAVTLVGKTVSVQVTDTDGKVSDSTSGTVTAVKFEDGVPKIVIGGIEYSLSDVTEVS
jgi:flagellar basal-body rod modification protein FlgD